MANLVNETQLVVGRGKESEEAAFLDEVNTLNYND